MLERSSIQQCCLAHSLFQRKDTDGHYPSPCPEAPGRSFQTCSPVGLCTQRFASPAMTPDGCSPKPRSDRQLTLVARGPAQVLRGNTGTLNGPNVPRAPKPRHQARAGPSCTARRLTRAHLPCPPVILNLIFLSAAACAYKIISLVKQKCMRVPRTASQGLSSVEVCLWLMD